MLLDPSRIYHVLDGNRSELAERESGTRFVWTLERKLEEDAIHAVKKWHEAAAVGMDGTSKCVRPSVACQVMDNILHCFDKISLTVIRNTK